MSIGTFLFVDFLNCSIKSPVNIKMDLTFAETEMITKEKIKQGF